MDSKFARNPEALASRWFSAFTSAASCLTVGAALVVSNVKPVAAQENNAKGNISFTADNAAEVFLNGKSLGQTNNWKQPFTFENLELQQGKNVIGIAAWDSEGIAAMSGEFKMPDGTEFGTTSFEDWLVFPADKNPNSSNGANSPFHKDKQNPLSVYKDILDIPLGWNEVDYTVSNFAEKQWVQPGYVTDKPDHNQSYPWSDPTGDPTWLWWGENSSDNKSDWWKMNFVLFRYEFECKLNYCAAESGWKELKTIDSPKKGDLSPRAWNDIIYGTAAGHGTDKSTLPVFRGGILSFENFNPEGRDDAYGKDNIYTPNFYVDDYAGNTIDNAGYSPVLTGVLSGPGGMQFSGNGTTTLEGINTYLGQTTVLKGTTLRVTGSLDEATTVKVDKGAKYQVFDDDTIYGLKGNGDVQIGRAGRDGNSARVVLTVSPSKGLRIFQGSLIGNGDFRKKGDGTQVLTGVSSFAGETKIEEGTLEVSDGGDLPDSTSVNVSSGALYYVGSTDTIGSLEGDGNVFLDADRSGIKVLSAGAAGDTTFSGEMTGPGGFTKLGLETTTTFSGINTYTGTTTIKQGTLKLGAVTGLPSASSVVIKPSGVLDLGGFEKEIIVNPNDPDGGDVFLDGGAGVGTIQDIMANTAVVRNGVLDADIVSDGGLLDGVSEADLLVRSGRTFIKNTGGTSLDDVVLSGGQLWIANRDLAGKSQSVVVDDFTLASKTIANPVAPTSASFSNNSLDGLVIGFDSQKDYSLVVSGEFKYESGNVYLYKPAESSNAGYEGVWNAIDFDKSDLTDAEYESLFSNTFILYQDPEGGYTDFGFKGSGRADQSTLIRPVALQQGSLRICVGSVFGDECGGMDVPAEDIVIEIEKEIEKEILGGGSSGSGGGSIVFEDDALVEIADEFELWTSDEIVEVVQRGLTPRNVDGAGQTLATYNNLLADTIFERTPMRQFTEVEPEVAVEPAPVVEPEVEPVPVGEPVRGLWSKSGELNDVDADAYLAEKTGEQPLVIADAQTTADHDAQHLIEINGKTYVENDSLTAEYADRDGVRGWFRGFGGQSADSNGESDTIYNPYGISAGGGIVGADVSLSESFQLGAYASYGDINLWQSSGVEGLGGGWKADGWGGGVTADYWTNNFYVQGLLGASGFSGQQKRSIKGYGVLFDDETAKGEKSASTMVGALRLGAPFQSGSTYFEPQFTATWSGNNENRFSESADDERLGLTYKSRKTNYLQTALGMKFAWPMKTGETGLFTPSVKLAWLGDWNQGNEDQTIGFDFTDETYSVGSNQENVNGALIEAGLDYNVAKVEGTSVKAYLRGGAEVWGGNRGTQWRASGGVTFQF